MKWLMHMGAVVLFTAASATGARADQWNDQTTLTFSAPIMVPGVTLAPGTYMFKLADEKTDRHLVQIFREDGRTLLATTQAVPITRPDASGDVVLKLNPTDAGAPVALKAWFYPGSRYGHEFIYPEEQARHIAERTKTLVLSTDVAGSDKEKGTLYNYDASGNRTAWRGDEQTMKEWNDWRNNRQAQSQTAMQGSQAENRGSGSAQQQTQQSAQQANRGQQNQTAEQAGQSSQDSPQSQGTSAQSGGQVVASGKVASAPNGDNGESSAAMMRNRNTQSSATKVSIDDLEDNPDRYNGQTINMTAEVDEVFGPRLFKIDEANWADLDQEILVYMPTALAALVQEGDRVTITGTMKPFVRADIDKETAWLWGDSGVRVSFDERPVLVASRIIGGDNKTVMAIDVNSGNTAGSNTTDTGASATSATETNRRGAGQPLTTPSAIAQGSTSIVGRDVSLSNVKVAQQADAPHKGFWIEAAGSRLFVMPSNDQVTPPTQGQTVSIEGVVLEMPRAIRHQAGSGSSGSATGSAGTSQQEDLYIYATAVR